METASAQPTSDRPESDRTEGRWIVGIDGSECSRHAALWAVEHARNRATELQLATAWSVPAAAMTTPMTVANAGRLYESCENTASAVVDDLVGRLAPSLDIPVTGSVGQGGAARLLLDAAASSDLLVVGSRGRGGFARLLLGSTSTQCATHSQTPVVVVPAAAPIEATSRIVVGLDGSPNSLAALEWAHAFAAPSTTILGVSVWDTSPLAVGSDRFFFPDASELAQARADELFSKTIAHCARSDVDTRHEFVEGHPREILRTYASRADMLVVGARGHGAVGAALLGSVSTWLLHHAKRATVVVPSPQPLDTSPSGEED